MTPMKTIKHYSIQYSGKQNPVSKFLKFVPTSIMVLAGMATAVLFSALFAALLLPVAGVSYFLWKKNQAHQTIETNDAIDAEFKEVKPDQHR